MNKKLSDQCDVVSQCPKMPQRRTARFKLAGTAGVAILGLAFSVHVALAADRVVLEPVDDPELARVLSGNFTLPMLVDLEGQTEAEVATAIDAEVQKLTGLLRSLGYLEGRVEMTGSATEEDPLRLVPVPGLLYRIGWIRVDGLPSPTPDPLRQALNAYIAQEVGKDATRNVLDRITSGVLFELREASYGKATVASAEIRMDDAMRTAGVIVNAEPGPSLSFGEVRFTGSYRIDNAEAQEFVAFGAGDPYSKTTIDQLHADLEDTGMFRRIRVELVDAPNAVDTVDVAVELRDRPPDPDALEESSGIGPTRLMITMFMLVLLECLRVTSYWSFPAVRYAVLSPVILMISVSGLMILNRLIAFLI